MGTKTIRLDDEIYERIRTEKREDETFSEAIERLIGDVSLLELAGGLSEEAAMEAKAAITKSRKRWRASMKWCVPPAASTASRALAASAPLPRPSAVS